MPVNSQSDDESGQSKHTTSTRMAGMVQRLERAAAKAGYTTRACSDQCLALVCRHGINANQLATEVTAAASKPAQMRINPFKFNKETITPPKIKPNSPVAGGMFG